MINAFIFARGGSKGLPGKNLRMLLGKSLLVHAIDCVATSKHVNKIIVATDSFDIAKAAYEHGASVLMRPDELCTDDSPEWLSWQYAMQKHPETKMFVSVPTTCPLRVATDIDATIEALGQDGYHRDRRKAAVTVTRATPNFFYTGVQMSLTNRILPIVFDQGQPVATRRQEADPAYNIVGSCYAAWPLTIHSQENLFAGEVGGVEIPPERAIDIDTAFDFEIVESLLLNRQAKQMMEEQQLQNLMRRATSPVAG